MGLHHGWFCAGCSWTLMAVLFVVGVMNLAWMGVLTLAIFLERVGPWGQTALYATSAALCISGALMLISPSLVPGI